MPQVVTTHKSDLGEQSCFEVIESPGSLPRFALPGTSRQTELSADNLSRVLSPLLDDTCLLLTCVPEEFSVLKKVVDHWNEPRHTHLFRPARLDKFEDLAARVAFVTESGGTAGICLDVSAATDETVTSLRSLSAYHSQIPVLLLQREHSADQISAELHRELIKFHYLIEQKIFDPTGPLDVFDAITAGLVLLSISTRTIERQRNLAEHSPDSLDPGEKLGMTLPDSWNFPSLKEIPLDKNPKLVGTTLFLNCSNLEDNHLAERVIRRDWLRDPFRTRIIQPLTGIETQGSVIEYVLKNGGAIGLVVEPEHIEPEQISALEGMLRYSKQIGLFLCLEKDSEAQDLPHIQALRKHIEEQNVFTVPASYNNRHFRAIGEELKAFEGRLQQQAAQKRRLKKTETI